MLLTPSSSPIDAGGGSLEKEESRRDSRLKECLSIIAEIEASVAGSTKALVASDLPGIESRTTAQASLIAHFAVALRQTRIEVDKHEEGAAPDSMVVSQARKELQRSQRRILEATRLQTALLVRLQRKMRALANMLAGSGVIYRPPMRGVELVGKHAGAQPCRA